LGDGTSVRGDHLTWRVGFATVCTHTLAGCDCAGFVNSSCSLFLLNHTLPYLTAADARRILPTDCVHATLRNHPTTVNAGQFTTHGGSVYDWTRTTSSHVVTIRAVPVNPMHRTYVYPDVGMAASAHLWNCGGVFLQFSTLGVEGSVTHYAVTRVPEPVEGYTQIPASVVSHIDNYITTERSKMIGLVEKGVDRARYYGRLARTFDATVPVAQRWFAERVLAMRYVDPLGDVITAPATPFDEVADTQWYGQAACCIAIACFFILFKRPLFFVFRLPLFCFCFLCSLAIAAIAYRLRGPLQRPGMLWARLREQSPLQAFITLLRLVAPDSFLINWPLRAASVMAGGSLLP
jgi:hypothetical protein